MRHRVFLVNFANLKFGYVPSSEKRRNVPLAHGMLKKNIRGTFLYMRPQLMADLTYVVFGFLAIEFELTDSDIRNQ